MNYDFWFLGDGGRIPDQFFGTVIMQPWARPTLHQELNIKGRLVRVERIVPPSNPDNVKVTYYVDDVRPNRPYREKKD